MALCGAPPLDDWGANSDQRVGGSFAFETCDCDHKCDRDLVGDLRVCDPLHLGGSGDEREEGAGVAASAPKGK